MTYWRAILFFFFQISSKFFPPPNQLYKTTWFQSKRHCKRTQIPGFMTTQFWKQLNFQIIQHKMTTPQEWTPRTHAGQNPTQASAHREPTQLNQIRSKTKAAAAKKNLDLPRQFSICSLFTMLANLLKNLYSLLWPILWRNHLLRPRSRRRQDYRWGLGRDRPRNRHHCHRQSQHGGGDWQQQQHK